jgi:hypothetical protein
MCRSCGDFVETRAGLSWAIPVDILKLGPHLEAYIQIKHVLHQVRLCHRFGTGPSAHLRKLPREVFDVVVDHFRNLTRAHLAPYNLWAKKLKCFQKTCKPMDHVDEDVISELREEFKDNIDESARIGSEAHKAYVEKVAIILDGLEWEGICMVRSYEWKAMVEQEPILGTVCRYQDSGRYEFAKYEEVSDTLSQEWQSIEYRTRFEYNCT